MSDIADAPPLTIDQAIANLQQTDDPGLRYYAAWWIGRFRVNHPDAIAALLAALEDEQDRSPDGGYPLRRNAARALGKLDSSLAVPALLKCLDSSDYYVREAAAQSLEMLGDPAAVPGLLNLLAGGVEAAIAVPDKPHLVQPYNAIIEALGTLGDWPLVPEIIPFLDHDQPQVRNAAARALYQLTGKPEYAERLVEVLYCPDLQLRRSALMDLGAVGYGPAAGAIARTLAENSMKLIALKGVLERQLCPDDFEGRLEDYAKRFDPLSLSAPAIETMALMDSLL
ncbi:HEAT repeat domain-containing protein [Romeria aff. gracilis LEGE 07310]|uniref:HEAT repeat domain-containing protein n=1 Tax=Vasconcelosia minhoensis LEGE 07310 TaxID=915328 RepID=A0A8J7ATP6_9CYAN|nr:HEAT repeat domain-containing protein [Romeria gracilis]MBE9076383.1 HEAT repeat domain-containing protein [Romeria aff. gracilis LEGE 07310]